jgi:uncharacterized protein (UPF0335 family)
VNSLTPETLAELKRLHALASPMFEPDHEVVLYTNGYRSDEEAHTAHAQLEELLLANVGGLIDNTEKVERLEEERNELVRALARISRKAAEPVRDFKHARVRLTTIEAMAMEAGTS